MLTRAQKIVTLPSEAQAKPKPRSAAHYLWAALIARIYEVFPLICPHCGGPMRRSQGEGALNEP